MRAQPTQARLEVASNLINAKFDGHAGQRRRRSPARSISAPIRSAVSPPGSAIRCRPETASAWWRSKANSRRADGVYSLRQTQMRFDSMSMNANLSFDTKPAVMTIKGNVTLDRLDLNPYLAPGTETDTVEAAKARKGRQSGRAAFARRAEGRRCRSDHGRRLDAAARLQARSRRRRSGSKAAC